MNWQKSLNKSELASALALAALGVFVVVEASAWGYMTKDGPGPAFFPLWIGIFIILLSLALIASQFHEAIKQQVVPVTNWQGAGRILSGWASLMAAIALLKPAGFTASFLLLVIFLVLVIFRRSLKAALTVGFVAALGFWVVFAKLLNLKLPAGPWGF